MPSRIGPEPNGIRCQKVYAPIEARWEDILRGFLANLPGELLTLLMFILRVNLSLESFLGYFEATFGRHCRWFYRGAASLWQRRFRLHFICWASSFAHHARWKVERWRGRAVAEQSGRFARKRELRGVCSIGHEWLNRLRAHNCQHFIFTIPIKTFYLKAKLKPPSSHHQINEVFKSKCFPFKLSVE